MPPTTWGELPAQRSPWHADRPMKPWANLNKHAVTMSVHWRLLTLSMTLPLSGRVSLPLAFCGLGAITARRAPIISRHSSWRAAWAIRSRLPTASTAWATGSGIYQSETSVPASISFAQCLHFGEQAIKSAREIGQRSAEAYTLVSLGQFLGPRGEYTRALEVAQAGLSLSEQIEHRQFMTFGHWELGVLYLELLALPEAQQQLEQALSLVLEVGLQYLIRVA